MNENEQRRNAARMASYGTGMSYMSGTGFWGFVSLILFNRATAGKWLDSTPLTKNPVRTFVWFMTGVSFAVFANVLRMREQGFDGKTLQLHTRVA